MTGQEPDGGSPAPRDGTPPCREPSQHLEELVQVDDVVNDDVEQEEPQPHRLGLLLPVLATGCRKNLPRMETEW